MRVRPRNLLIQDYYTSISENNQALRKNFVRPSERSRFGEAQYYRRGKAADCLPLGEGGPRREARRSRADNTFGTNVGVGRMRLDDLTAIAKAFWRRKHRTVTSSTAYAVPQPLREGPLRRSLAYGGEILPKRSSDGSITLQPHPARLMTATQSKYPTTSDSLATFPQGEGSLRRLLADRGEFSLNALASQSSYPIFPSVNDRLKPAQKIFSKFLKVQKTFSKKFSGGVWGETPQKHINPRPQSSAGSMPVISFFMARRSRTNIWSVTIRFSTNSIDAITVE